jgi:glycosyltransferase involved in cell wall biosynthesis
MMSKPERTPSISACLIVRDEAKVLRRCLDSIQGAVDQLCILDTGSLDDTPKIAKEFGAKFKRFTACNDSNGRITNFAMARNECIRMANGEWILSIDADEVLSKSSIERIRWHALHDRSAAVRVRLRFKGTEWLAVRLFRRDPKHEFRGRVHEWVSIRGQVSEDASILITNRPNKRGKESSAQRDLRLCSLALQENPKNRVMVFYLARALRRMGQFEPAIKEFERYLRLEKKVRSLRHAAAYGIAVCHFLNRNWKHAIRAAKVAYKIDSRLAESHCLIADAYLALAQYGNAVRWYQRALECKAPPADHTLFVDPACYAKYPQKQLSRFRFIKERS